jgi:divalent metal cation (Fe/Co/Zn/Cd) transporter
MLDLKSLITGRAVSTEIAADIRRTAMAVPGVRDVLDLRALYIGSTSLLVILEVHLDDDFTTGDIERILDEIKARVVKDIPEATHVQVEVETPDSEISVLKATD